MKRGESVATTTLQATAVALIVAALPHLVHLPLWVLALIPAAVALRLALGRPPARWLLIVLVVLVFAAVLTRFRSIAGPSAGGAFFCAMVALKYLESRDRRDVGILLCLAFFLATSVFLSSEAIGVAALVLLSVFVTMTALTWLAEPDGPPTTLRLRQSLGLLLRAVPVMLVLFLLFPRLPGPLWSIGSEDTGRTGLDDHMAPGDITRLIRSSAVAFRAQFDGEPPAPSARYWRGPVLWSFDGREWTRGQPRHRGLQAPQATERVRDYTLTLEPSGRKWLFALDVPIRVTGADGADVSRKTGYNLVTQSPVDSVRRFELHSALDYRLEPDLPPARRQRALALPSDAAPRARQLVARWRETASRPRDYVDRALAFLREHDFVYTLTPPKLDDRPVDTFLFATRAGFCEHYASAFTVMMRIAGVPARIVTGYQGGEMNNLGDYMIVRQSDAHAWTEVWLPEQGWTRVDPTSAVSRTRLDAGIGSVDGADDRLPLLSRPDGGVLKQLALIWDSVDHGWDRFVLGYGPALQQRLLQRLGLQRLGDWALAALMLVTVMLMLAAIWLLTLRPGGPSDPATRLWLRAQRRLRRIGIEPGRSEGPMDLAARVRRERPDAGPAFSRVVAAYVRLRYRPEPDATRLDHLRLAVRAFRPRRR